MDKNSVLWQGAVMQDNLLQSYRGFHLTIQSILIAIGAGLSVATLSFHNDERAIYAWCLLSVISFSGIYLLITMRKLIRARGEDVDYFHNRIIEHEDQFSKSEQVMTMFKVHQKYHRNKSDIEEYFSNFDVSPNIRKSLTEKGKGHTRKLLDSYLFYGFFCMWVSFHIITLSSIIIK